MRKVDSEAGIGRRHPGWKELAKWAATRGVRPGPGSYHERVRWLTRLACWAPSVSRRALVADRLGDVLIALDEALFAITGGDEFRTLTLPLREMYEGIDTMMKTVTD